MAVRVPVLDQTNTVVNVVMLDVGDTWTPPDGLRIGKIGGEIGDTWNGAAYVKPAPSPVVYTLDDYDLAVQGHLDATAKARGYRDAATCISYLSSTNPTWAAEAAVFAPWRDVVWLYAFEQLALVQGGQRSQPTPAELVDELPAIEWP